MDPDSLFRPPNGGESPFTIPPAPLMAFLDVTPICNLKCTFCYNAIHVKQGHPSFETLQNIIHILAVAGCKEVLYLGGEPTLHPQFLNLLLFAQELGIKQSLVSNGQIIDNKMADFFGQIPNLLVGISIHGHVAQVHDSLSGVPGSWQKAVNAIKRLESRNVCWYAQMSLLRTNYKCLPKLHQFVMNLGKPERLDLSRMIADGRGCRQENFLNEQEWERLFCLMHDLDLDKLRCKIESFPRCWVRNVSAKYGLNYERLKTCLRPCNILITQLCLDCFGNARLCPTGGNILGNVITDGIDQIWNGNNIVREFRTFEWLGQPCRNNNGKLCSEFYYCSGGCRRSLKTDSFNADSFRKDR